MILKAVGLLSPGDMGHLVGKVLISNGMSVLTCLEGRSSRTKALAIKAGIKSVPSYDSLVNETEMILSILVPGEAINAAKKVAQALLDNDRSIVYVDCNAISPMTSNTLDEIIRNAGGRYVDASIIGPPPRRKGLTKFFASGPNVEDFQVLSNYGLDVRILGLEIGQGKGIKMAYGALTKGFIAISTQLLIAARKMGLYNSLVDLFMETQTVLYERMKRTVPNMPHRSRRWVSEMKEISKTFESLKMTPKIYAGAAELYQSIGKTSLADETAETMEKDRTLDQTIRMLIEDWNV
jgi:3-hydroxyisobutyrate dehydrogenase-like beta-hydroxyacid dehydrogenase